MASNENKYTVKYINIILTLTISLLLSPIIFDIRENIMHVGTMVEKLGRYNGSRKRKHIKR